MDGRGGRNIAYYNLALCGYLIPISTQFSLDSTGIRAYVPTSGPDKGHALVASANHPRR